jgi:hypothetical protein
MSFLDPDYKVDYPGRGDTGPYPITFSVQLDSGGNAKDIVAKLLDADDVETDITDDCTVTGLNVYTDIAYAATYTVVIIRFPALSQPYSLGGVTKFPSRTFEAMVDRAMYCVQRLALESEQAFKVPLSEDAPARVPSIVDRASKWAAFDALGALIAVAGAVGGYPTSAFMATVLTALTAGDAQTALGISAFIKTLLDDANEITAQSTLGLGVVSSSTTPYTMTSSTLGRVFLITTGASAFVFNIASAATILDRGPFTIIKVDSGAGVIEVKPNGTDVWANAGNVSCYLAKEWESLTFTASKSGELTVLGGAFIPHQTVDTDGTQLHLGKLIHLPLGNITYRSILDQDEVPAENNWSSAYQVTGSYGVPTGARAVRLKSSLLVKGLAAGWADARICFSDNNSNAASDTTAHPSIAAGAYCPSAGASTIKICTEIDVPLNSLGRFYVYTDNFTNTNSSNTSLWATVIGYYMGN